MNRYLERWRNKAYKDRLKAWDCDHDEGLPALSQTGKAPRRRKTDIMLGSANAKTLDQAIAAVDDGGCIIVPEGVHTHKTPIETAKSFELVGSGAATCVLVGKVTDDCLYLKGAGSWKLSGVSLLMVPAKKKAAGDLLLASERARVEVRSCLLGGAVATVRKNGNVAGGCGVRAVQGAKVALSDCQLELNHWGAAAHDGGAAVELIGGSVSLCEFGLFAGDGGTAVANKTLIPMCRHAVKTWGQTASATLTQCSLKYQLWTAAYAEGGSLRLDRCRIHGADGYGVACEAGAELVALRCKIRECCRSGIWIDGKAKVERNQCNGNGIHGIELGPSASGRVTANRCTQNDRFGILRDPASRARLTDNKTKGNDDEGVYVLGTLGKRLAKGFPKGVALPDKLAKLARYQEENRRILGETYLGPGPLVGWAALKSEFAVFANGPDGSPIAFWLYDGRDIDTAPIVHIDSDGSNCHVFADSLDDHLSLLASGIEDFAYPVLEEDVDDEDELDRLRAWLDDELGIKPAKSRKKIVAKARRKHPDLAKRLWPDHPGPETARASTNASAKSKRASRRRGAGQGEGAVKRLLKKELPDTIRNEGSVRLELAPLKELPKGLPAKWRKVLASADPVPRVLEEIWHPWRLRLPKTVDALEASLRHVALLQTAETPASLLYVFEQDGERYFQRGYRCRPIKGRWGRFSGKELTSRLPRKFLDLYQIHDGWPGGLGCGLLRAKDWYDLTEIYDEDELSEVAPGVPLTDYLIVHDAGGRYLGFDMTKKRPRCLAWHPREPFEVVADAVAWLDDDTAQGLADYAE